MVLVLMAFRHSTAHLCLPVSASTAELCQVRWLVTNVNCGRLMQIGAVLRQWYRCSMYMYMYSSCPPKGSIMLLRVSTDFVLTLQLFRSPTSRSTTLHLVFFYLEHGEPRRSPGCRKENASLQWSPYGVRDLLRAGDVPAMLAAGYIQVSSRHAAPYCWTITLL